MKHTESKHHQNGAETKHETKLEVDIIFKLILEAQKDISKDECYSTIIRSTVKNFIFIDSTELLTNEIQKLYNSLCSNADAEKIYSQFYKLIVMDAKKYFNSLDFPMCGLLAARLTDKILAHYSRPADHENVIKPLTERGMQALQYLSGYVIHSLVRKIHRFTNWRSTDSQALLTLLYAAKSDDFSFQRLISCQTRGGLWAVTAECLQVFKIMEEEFRKETSAVHVTKIDSSKISEALPQRIDTVSAYDSMTHGFTTTISKEIRFCLLDKTIKLFL